MIDPIDAEFQELVDDYEAERNLAHVYPARPSLLKADADLDGEELDLYAAAWEIEGAAL